jgi:malonate decarboxylase gamma subunit
MHTASSLAARDETRKTIMTSLDTLLDALFPRGHDVANQSGLLRGTGLLRPKGRATVVGVSDRTAVGVDDALQLADHVLRRLDADDGPIVVLVDSDSQRMSKRDELLGLNEFVAHLAKTLIVADLSGRTTIGVLYGHSAAGAFLGTALATRVLAALPDADPMVMDLPSMAKVTKLSAEVLAEKAKSTPVFAPGVDNLARMGAVHQVWDLSTPLAAQFEALLASAPLAIDRRDELGATRGGRPKAAAIAARVHQRALEGLRTP